MLFAVEYRTCGGEWKPRQMFAENWSHAESLASAGDFRILGPIYLIGYPGSNPENREKVEQ